jgi:hypothetical protein
MPLSSPRTSRRVNTPTSSAATRPSARAFCPASPLCWTSSRSPTSPESKTRIPSFVPSTPVTPF